MLQTQQHGLQGHCPRAGQQGSPGRPLAHPPAANGNGPQALQPVLHAALTGTKANVTPGSYCSSDVQQSNAANAVLITPVVQPEASVNMWLKKEPCKQQQQQQQQESASEHTEMQCPRTKPDMSVCQEVGFGGDAQIHQASANDSTTAASEHQALDSTASTLEQTALNHTVAAASVPPLNGIIHLDNIPSEHTHSANADSTSVCNLISAQQEQPESQSSMEPSFQTVHAMLHSLQLPGTDAVAVVPPAGSLAPPDGLAAAVSLSRPCGQVEGLTRVAHSRPVTVSSPPASSQPVQGTLCGH